MADEVKRFLSHRVRAFLALALVLGLPACHSLPEDLPDFGVTVTESIVYTTPNANNGAGPLWNFNATNIARIGDTVWVSGLNTVTGLPPLNNTECNLWKKAADAAWERVLTLPGLTREPCPMGVLQGGRLLISTNATLNSPGKPGGGPARPGLWEAMPTAGFGTPAITQPGWRAQAGPFTEHSYRSLAVDGQRGEVFLMQNVGNSHVEWAFRDDRRAWSAQGRLDWPVKEINGRAMPLRVCYVVALVKDRAVHLLGVSDVVEPNEDWRAFKRKLTGKPWDYVFRNLYYTWTPDITAQPFRPWLEVASREATAGRITPGDLWVDRAGAVHAVWEDITLDHRLRDQFFPGHKQHRGISYALIRDGQISQRSNLLAAEEGLPGPVPHWPRWHATADGRMFMFFYVDGVGQDGKRWSENRLAEVRDGAIAATTSVPLRTPINLYVTASAPAWDAPSDILDLLGTAPGAENTVRHIALRIRAARGL